MRWAEDRQAIDFATVEKLSCNEAGLDRLADPDVVGDEKTHGVVLERHHERHKLIGLRREPDPPGAPERTRASAQSESEGVAH